MFHCSRWPLGDPSVQVWQAGAFRACAQRALSLAKAAEAKVGCERCDRIRLWQFWTWMYEIAEEIDSVWRCSMKQSRPSKSHIVSTVSRYFKVHNLTFFGLAPGSSTPGTPSTEAAPAAAAEPPDVSLREAGGKGGTLWNLLHVQHCSTLSDGNSATQD